MLRERGIVERISAQKAVLRIERTSACAACESRNSCHLQNSREFFVEVDNELHVEPGDVVEVSMPSSSVIRASLAVYFLPVLGLILGALAGGASAAALRLEATTASLAGGAIGLVLSIIVLKRLDRSVRARPDYFPRMTKVLKKPVPPHQHDDSK
ncbi:MAG: SoxR reducing system RseC family protein [Deltaproteobacteria bacterium]|nr:SoxR reducing system RseC family protein [Deltaproteobacteria bacterium]